MNFLYGPKESIEIKKKQLTTINLKKTQTFSFSSIFSLSSSFFFLMDRHRILNLVHLSILVPFLLNLLYRWWAPSWLFTLVTYMAVGVGLYHAFLAWKKIQGDSSSATWAWVNLWHAAVVAPLLWIVGREGGATSEGTKQGLKFLAMAATLFHGSKVINLI